MRSNRGGQAGTAENSAPQPPGANGTGHINCQAFTGVLVHHSQAFDLATIGSGVKDEVVGPHHVHLERGMGARPARGDALGQ